MAKAQKVSKGANPEVQRIAGDELPRRSLEQVMRIAECLHQTYAGKETAIEDIAAVLDIGPKSANTRYLFWSAQAYGVIIKGVADAYSLSETGRKIVAPTYEGEDREAKIKAVLTPAILSKFYLDFNDHPLPSSQHLPNVLESKLGVPRSRIEEVVQIILSNARYAGILDESDPQHPVIRVEGSLNPKRQEETSVSPSDSIAEPNPTGSNSYDWEHTCFYITPIGDEGSESRKHSDLMLKHLLEPVLGKVYGFNVVRADKIDRSGFITSQIFEQIAKARLCVADLSFRNPNAFYELGVRHAFILPTIQLIRKGDPIPFDVAQGRTITIDTSDPYTIMDRIISGQKELSEHVRHMLAAKPTDATDDNPVKFYLPKVKVSIP